jgi:hypothetical protein
MVNLYNVLRPYSELEEMAAASAIGGKKRRTASMHQVKWLRELVSVHGEDIDAMVRDGRRNVWQKTSGELRRAYVCQRQRCSRLAPHNYGQSNGFFTLFGMIV